MIFFTDEIPNIKCFKNVLRVFQFFHFIMFEPVLLKIYTVLCINIRKGATKKLVFNFPQDACLWKESSRFLIKCLTSIASLFSLYSKLPATSDLSGSARDLDI